MNNRFNRLIPKVGKTGLLVYAACIWTFGGFMLYKNGQHYLPAETSYRNLKIVLAVVAGMGFYMGMFRKISRKYILRIQEVSKEKTLIFHAFEKRSYILLTIMITMGISFRLSGLVPIEYLSLFYFTMGTPLFISSVRFLRSIYRNLA